MIPMKNIIVSATDGAAAMVGKYCGFTAILKKAIPLVKTIHCVVHQQHLVAKKITEPLNSSMDIVIKSVNKIKAHRLNSRLFKQLCSDNDEKLERLLLLHTEVSWLSIGICLTECSVSSVVEFWTQWIYHLQENSTKSKTNCLPGWQFLRNSLTSTYSYRVMRTTSWNWSLLPPISFRAELGTQRLQNISNVEWSEQLCWWRHTAWGIFEPPHNFTFLIQYHLINIEADMKKRFTDLLSFHLDSRPFLRSEATKFNDLVVLRQTLLISGVMLNLSLSSRNFQINNYNRLYKQF